jgi:predicted nucleic acid-binding protein
MILVDSSVWIDFFRDNSTPQTNVFDTLLGHEPVALGDLILTEVLQGFRLDRDFQQARRLVYFVDRGRSLRPSHGNKAA